MKVLFQINDFCLSSCLDSATSSIISFLLIESNILLSKFNTIKGESELYFKVESRT